VITFDYHTHHYRCGHAQGTIEDYVQAAIQLDLQEIGISDHAPLYWLEGDQPIPGSAMARSHLASYVEEVLSLRKKYAGRIRVLLGLEADYFEGWEDVYREALAPYPFDYVIGSVHYVHGLHIYDTRRWRECEEPEGHFAEYFRLVRQSARSGLFDILGHTTGLLAYGPAPSSELLEREFAQTAAVVAEAGVAVEINASGIRKGGPEPFPAGALLREYVAAGVPLTYGSDSHLPSEVGHAREFAAGLLSGAKRWSPSPEGAAIRRSAPTPAAVG
jgi:histidinol-phosphatase (PHP family)